jgi:type I restriction enzyme S subunit
MNEVAINPEQLPPSWALTTLGAVVNYGSTTKAEPTEIADGDWVLELEDIEKDSSRLLQKMTFLQRQSKSTKNHFQAGDVLYGKLRPYLNKVLIADEVGYCTTEILPLKAGAHLDNRYLFYWLKHPAFLKYVEAESHGMNMPRLGTDAGKAAPFVLAPRSEQTRIANQLDSLLTRIQSCNDRFDAIPALLKRFRQTILDAALSGAFSESGVGAGASKVSISSIASVGTGSTPLRSNSQFFASIGTPWVTSSATSEAIIVQAHEFVTPAGISAHRLKVYPKGTLLVAMYGEGKTRGQVAELGIDATINQACAAVVVAGTKALIAFVKLALQANYLNMRELAEGGNQPNLNLSKVKEFEIPLPPLEVQTEIVRRVEALFTLADRIEARATAARSHAQRLSPLVLAKAFRGELTPQEPSDEPASVLLARIASSNTAVAGKSKRKVPVAP